MRRLIVCGLMIGIGLLAGGAAVAQLHAQDNAVHRRAHGPLGQLIMERLGRAAVLHDELNLTDAQRDAVHQTLGAHRDEIVAAAKPVVEARRALRDAVLAQPTDEPAIRGAAGDLGDAIGDAAVVFAKVKADLLAKANFTQEQLEMIQAFHAEKEAAIDQFLLEHHGQGH